MLADNLFQRVLLDPPSQGADQICIVSGYASAVMVLSHFEALRKLNLNHVSIKLIAGMCLKDGISLTNHTSFKNLMDIYSEQFECSYIYKGLPVHSKVYVWLKDNKPIAGFAGSANYSQSAFLKSVLREFIVQIDPNMGFEYFSQLIDDAIFCNHIETEDYITIVKDSFYEKLYYISKKDKEDINIIQDSIDFQKITISFLDKNGDLPSRSGLNWGQRPEYNRNRNQAYIRLPSQIYTTDFFPERTLHFTVITDDHKQLICTRAQDNAKAIHTPHNNSLLGEYFRSRMGLPSGSFIKKDDLIRYGRCDVDFYKIDDETYFMDFSV